MRSIGLLLAIALVIGILSISWRQMAAARQTGGNELDELTANQRLGQTFQAPFFGLYRVDVTVLGLTRQNPGHILFHLCDGVGGPEIATIEIDADQNLWQVRWLVLIAAAAKILGTGVLPGELLIAGTKKV